MRSATVTSRSRGTASACSCRTTQRWTNCCAASPCRSSACSRSSCRSAPATVTTMTTDALLALLQLGDGLFPAGGFAHSFGLETYAQEGRVRDRAGLEAFVTAHLEGAAGPGDAVAVAVATRLATAGDLAAWCELDARVDAMKTVPEFRAASRQMGRQTARVAAALGDDAFLPGIVRAIDDGLAPGHHAAVFGAAAGRFGAGAETAAAAYLYSTAALLVGAGLRLRDALEMAVITNDIYTKEDAEFLVRRGALGPERVVGVETGGCPHTAIREDASVNLEAVHDLLNRFPGLDLLLIESGGDNLAATFSPGLVDATIYVIDVAEGEM